MTRTKRTVARVGFDPFEWLLSRAKDTERDEDAREALCLELLPYLRPKLRSLDVTGQLDSDVVVRIVLGED